MKINKKNRTEIKDYFKINDKPTQEEFAEFIESGLNQIDDGIAKVQGNPISIQAEGERISSQELLDFYENFTDDNPQWSINLNPRIQADEPSSNQPGLNIKDTKGQSRFFIKSKEGNIGIGTIEPDAKVSIEGKNITSLLSITDTSEERATVFEVKQQQGNGIVNIRNDKNDTQVQLSGSANTSSFFLGKLGIGSENPMADLHLEGINAELRITNSDQSNATTARLSLENSKRSEHWEIGLQQGHDSLQFFSSKHPSKKIVMKKDGTLESSRGLIFGGSDTEHILQNGSMYQNKGRAFLVASEDFLIKNTNVDEEAKFHFNTKLGSISIGHKNPKAPLSITGEGKERDPDGAMHITNRSILFGGGNGGKFSFSGKIIAHDSNALRILGMTSDQSSSTRRVEIFAEGGLTTHGHNLIPEKYLVAFSVAISTDIKGVRNPVVFKHINYNYGGHFKNEKHFIAPVKGMYQFSITMRHNTGDGDVGWKLRLNDTDFVNGGGTSKTESQERSWLIAKTAGHMNSRTVNTLLQAGDKVHVEQFGSGGNDNYASTFEGILLQAVL